MLQLVVVCKKAGLLLRRTYCACVDRSIFPAKCSWIISDPHTLRYRVLLQAQRLPLPESCDVDSANHQCHSQTPDTTATDPRSLFRSPVSSTVTTRHACHPGSSYGGARETGCGVIVAEISMIHTPSPVPYSSRYAPLTVHVRHTVNHARCPLCLSLRSTSRRSSRRLGLPGGSWSTAPFSPLTAPLPTACSPPAPCGVGGTAGPPSTAKLTGGSSLRFSAKDASCVRFASWSDSPSIYARCCLRLYNLPCFS